MILVQTPAPTLLLLILLTSCSITGNTALEIPVETAPEPLVYFCSREDCETILVQEYQSATTIDCAFYDLDSQPIIDVLRTKKTRLVLEGENFKKTEILTKKETGTGLMHNKFCILDNNRIITGSWNPKTKSKTANNVVVIHSRNLAQNYREEFEELWHGQYQTGKKVLHQKIILNDKLVENYFCPEDDCEHHVIDTLKNARKSIHFMTYSFTSDAIGDTILAKAADLPITGIFDSSQITEWSEYEKLKDYSMVKKGIHHKVFIIDNEIVITGSYNPTKNGNERNDENLLIIHDQNIAEQFLAEFTLLPR